MFHDNVDFPKGVSLVIVNALFMWIPTFSQFAAVISFIGSLGALVLTVFGIIQAFQRVQLNRIELAKNKEAQEKEEGE
jgi:hypothetical protein